MRATSCTRHPNAHWVNPCSKAAPLALHLGLWAVCAGRRFIVPAALLVFIQDVCGLTRKDLLCSSTLGCLTRRVMAGERLRECAVDAIGPSAIMLDDLIPELAHVGFLIFVVSTLARAFRPLQRAYIGVALRENEVACVIGAAAAEACGFPDSPIPLPQRLLAEGLGTAILVATVVGPSVWPAEIKQSRFWAIPFQRARSDRDHHHSRTDIGCPFQPGGNADLRDPRRNALERIVPVRSHPASLRRAGTVLAHLV